VPAEPRGARRRRRLGGGARRPHAPLGLPRHRQRRPGQRGAHAAAAAAGGPHARPQALRHRPPRRLRPVAHPRLPPRVVQLPPAAAGARDRQPRLGGAAARPGAAGELLPLRQREAPHRAPPRGVRCGGRAGRRARRRLPGGPGHAPRGGPLGVVGQALEPLGHAAQLAELRDLWRDGAGPRTLLFAGPESVGRRPAARRFAAYVNCSGPAEARPCGVCPSCSLLAAGTHPDLKEVAPRATTSTGRAKRSLELRIDQLVPREGGDPEPLGPWLLTRPRFTTRVGVIDHAESLNVAAANAFLKLLEERPAWARIVLVAPGPEAVLPTVASRAAPVRFRPVDAAELERLAPGATDHPAVRLGQPGALLRAAEGSGDGARRAAE